MRRRTIAGSMSAAIAVLLLGTAPSTARAETVLKVMLDGEVKTLDPVFTTESMAQQHSLMIYDTLMALDSKRMPQPQMASGYERSADGLTWRFKLRDGLQFHDGSPVEAKDVVASFKRWSASSAVGEALLAFTEEFCHRPPDLRDPAQQAVRAGPGGAGHTPEPPVHPRRRKPDRSDTAVTEAIGSGPFVRRGEWVPGSKVVYVKNPTMCRAGSRRRLAGGKLAKVDRVEWIVIPDATTAAQALIAGEVDMHRVPAAT